MMNLDTVHEEMATYVKKTSWGKDSLVLLDEVYSRLPYHRFTNEILSSVIVIPRCHSNQPSSFREFASSRFGLSETVIEV